MHKSQRRLFWTQESKAIRDALIIFGLTAIIIIFSISIEAFERIVEFSQTHESWEIDEFLTAALLLPIALCVFSYRRVAEAMRLLSERVEAEENAKEMALHDALTGLPNRRMAMDKLNHALEYAYRDPVTIVAVDLNRFKSINDVYGHNIGDQILLMAGQKLRSNLREGEIAARLGGDEFLLILNGRADSDDIIQLIETISSTFDTSFDIGPHNFSVGASFGVAHTDNHKIDIDEFMVQADMAMYRAKEIGSNGIAYFEPGMEQAALRRSTIELELRNALTSGEIYPHYQPLIDLETGDTVGFEALARWKTPGGLVRLPIDFISIAEQCGLISDLFFTILRAACVDVRNWPAHCHVAINLSPVQFSDPELAQRILGVLIETGVAPGRIEIEITESALVSDLDNAIATIISLKNQGVRISLDDFGTGYSSLRHLSDLPIDKLKIDRSFVENLDNDEASRTIVRAVTGLAHNLGLTVVAEGIETQENASHLSQFGCDFGQGYYFGRPAAAQFLMPFFNQESWIKISDNLSKISNQEIVAQEHNVHSHHTAKKVNGG
ncbi:hypothetical protein LPB140_03625 [Sphingorhabdus lutea]|uniref:EAL domain-containing protein n=1 Tax=Sphingorhabdus lutea TaxID=1913578 RepID=A0A1L3JA95_9SPHN|nr:EAL domain-containing protein [Sphingorhabdus lutea]APG62055.1 hypothetical protein LPB140_03625 [Sphingorhabdus lutea]